LLVCQDKLRETAPLVGLDIDLKADQHDREPLAP